MGVFKIMTIIQIVAFIQGYENRIATEHPKVNVKYGYSGSCSWTLSTSRNKTSVITVEDIYSLSSQICLSLGCDDVYKLKAFDIKFNSTCLTGCLYHNSELQNCSQIVRSHCKILSEVICGSPYVALTSSPCTWTIKSPDTESSVSLTEDIVHKVSNEICHKLGCGQIYSLTKTGSNTTCFTNCVYHNHKLKNCTQVINSNCSILSEVKCGNAAVRLVGGGHHCAGRVEVWQGSWGTVCDDGWDMEDANVVCSQLGCGDAVSVSGQGEPYGQGSGPIHLDELRCSGMEKSLWECPALTQDHDCGHKEDAGVVCSAYKALRLTGGLDRCSGRVEVHRNGSWGTVCDTSWQKEEATMACDMLNCGMVKHFTAFDPPFKHTNETLWYFSCAKNSTNLWQCQEYVNNEFVCRDTKAAGLICNNSLGLPVPTSQKPTSTPATTEIRKEIDSSHGPFLSPELLGCFVLGFFLLIAVIANILLCHRHKKKKDVIAQKRYIDLQTKEQVEENNYRDSVCLVKVTNNSSDEVSVFPQRVWPQSSIESGSYDTDYEHHDISPEVIFPLSTFQNSMRYSADGKTSAVKITNLNIVMEDVNSFESSCTSSEECYGNTKENRDSLQTPDNENIPKQEDSESRRSVLGHTIDPPFSYRDKVDGSREDSPLYSPVSYDNEAASAESDYDDIGNYIQQPSHLH